MIKAHYYPSPKPDGKYSNPYSIYFRESLEKHFKVVDTQLWKGDLLPFQLVISSMFRADIYIYNWIENFGYKRFKQIQYRLLILCFKIIKWRRKKIVWIFHNIKPHSKSDLYSMKIMNYLYLHANLIVAHSKEAERHVRQNSRCKVIYMCHPIVPIKKTVGDSSIRKYDVLIWGTILPYKGIPEFLSYVNSVENNLQILIIGNCSDEKLACKIESQCNDRIKYFNKRVDFQDLQQLVQQAHYVVFPYIGESVSSSGALIDTIAMNGNVIGPNKGAFRDLSEEGCCFIYNSYDELMDLLKGNYLIDRDKLNDFIQRHSWDNFVDTLIKEI